MQAVAVCAHLSEEIGGFVKTAAVAAAAAAAPAAIRVIALMFGDIDLRP